MAALNQAKIIKALEKMVAAPNKDCIFSFLSAYGIPNATIKRLQMGDPQRNLAKIPGDIALSTYIYWEVRVTVEVEIIYSLSQFFYVRNILGKIDIQIK